MFLNIGCHATNQTLVGSVPPPCERPLLPNRCLTLFCVEVFFAFFIGSEDFKDSSNVFLDAFYPDPMLARYKKFSYSILMLVLSYERIQSQWIELIPNKKKLALMPFDGLSRFYFSGTIGQTLHQFLCFLEGAFDVLWATMYFTIHQICTIRSPGVSIVPTNLTITPIMDFALLEISL